MSTYADLSPLARQDLAACNAGTWAMSDADRERWFAEHPVSAYTDEAMAPLLGPVEVRRNSQSDDWQPVGDVLSAEVERMNREYGWPKYRIGQYERHEFNGNPAVETACGECGLSARNAVHY